MSVFVVIVEVSPDADPFDVASHYADLIRATGEDTGEVLSVSVWVFDGRP
jgi:hypothetical protein